MKIKKIIPYVLIAALAVLVWYKTLHQTFLGEGYYYFDPTQNFLPTNNPGVNLWQYDNFARLLFDILPAFFKDNIQLYLGFQLIVMVIIYFSLYFMLTKITRNKLVSFTAVAIFLSSYIGSTEMLADGNYQRFVQRVPNLIPIIFSFYFLDRFLEGRNFKHYIFSISLFAIAVFMAHFSTFILPLFIFYPLVKALFTKQNIKQLFKASLISLSFILVNLFLISRDYHKPDHTFREFMTKENRFIERTLYQIPSSIFPEPILKLAADNWPTGKIPRPYISLTQHLVVILGGLYLIGLIILIKQANKLTPLYVACMLSVVVSMFLYAYEDRTNVLTDVGQGRQYFFPSLLNAVLLSIFIRSVFGTRKKLYRVITISFLVLYIAYNSSLINSHLDPLNYKVRMMNNVVQHVKSISPNFTSNSVMLLPSQIIWPAPMLGVFYAPPGMKIELYSEDILKELSTYKDNVFILDYDYEESSSKPLLERGTVVDLTSDYRNGKKLNFKLK